MSLVERYQALVCDLDGVVYRGPSPVDHAVEALGSAGVPVHYATNNASRPPDAVAEHLLHLGLSATTEDVTTSSQAGAWVLEHHVPTGSAVLAIGGPGVPRALRESGFDVVLPIEAQGAGAPVAVLQGLGAEVTAADLAEAAYAIEAGARWVATNTDATLPTDRGVAPGNGALIGAVERAVGRGPDDIAGKPHPPLYRLCAERLGQPVERVLAIGDRLETDIEGAVRTGMDSVLVLTGVHTLRDAARAAAKRRPTFVLPDLRGLGAQLPTPVVVEGWGSCGRRRRRVDAAGWRAEGEGSPLEDLNAALLAAYAALDAGSLTLDGLDAVWDEMQCLLREVTAG